jgi:phage terminase small subunit
VVKNLKETINNELTPKQKAFVEEYVIDLNGTQSAIRAGYSAKTANRIASENLSKPVIQAAIQEAKQQRSERTRIDADFVLLQISEYLDCCFGRKPIRKVVNIDGNMESIEVTEFNQSGVGKAIELMGKHINVQALKEKQQIDTNSINSLHDPYPDMSDQEVEARIQELVLKLAN